MRKVTMTNPETGSTIALVWHPHRDAETEVELLQNGQFGRYLSSVAAEKGIAAAIAKGWPVTETIE